MKPMFKPFLADWSLETTGQLPLPFPAFTALDHTFPFTPATGLISSKADSVPYCEKDPSHDLRSENMKLLDEVLHHLFTFSCSISAEFQGEFHGPAYCDLKTLLEEVATLYDKPCIRTTLLKINTTLEDLIFFRSELYSLESQDEWRAKICTAFAFLLKLETLCYAALMQELIDFDPEEGENSDHATHIVDLILQH